MSVIDYQKTFDQAYMVERRKHRLYPGEIKLIELEESVPWGVLERVVSKYYDKTGFQGGRYPYPFRTMLRIYVFQAVNNKSDLETDEALNTLSYVREFAGIPVGGRIPDETTILRFRHLLEKHHIGEEMFYAVNEEQAKQDLFDCGDTIVDATFIAAATSTKNAEGRRDPEMSSGKKGNTWHYGMKMHVGVEAEHGLIHSICFTAAREHDITQAHRLLHGRESWVFGDAGYIGLLKRPEIQGRNIVAAISMRPGQRRKYPKGGLVDRKEKLKSQVRAKVEHVFRGIKGVFGYVKAKYKGIAKNAERLFMLATMYNIVRARKLVIG